MKEAYAVRRTVPPSAEIEAQIDRLLAVGVGEHPREALSELAKLGARLIIQRAVEDEFDAWLGRARYERRAEGAPGLRHGVWAARGGAAGAAQRLSAAPGADGGGRAFGRDPAGPGGGRAVRVQAVPARHQAAADRAAAGDGDRRVRAWPVDARRGVVVRAGRAREAVEVDRGPDLHRAARPLRRLPAPRSLRRPRRRAVPRRGLSLGPPRRAQGGRARGVGIHRGGRTRAAVGDAGDARVARGLAGTRARSDRPWPRGADAG